MNLQQLNMKQNIIKLLGLKSKNTGNIIIIVKNTKLGELDIKKLIEAKIKKESKI